MSYTWEVRGQGPPSLAAWCEGSELRLVGRSRAKPRDLKSLRPVVTRVALVRVDRLEVVLDAAERALAGDPGPERELAELVAGLLKR